MLVGIVVMKKIPELHQTVDSLLVFYSNALFVFGI